MTAANFDNTMSSDFADPSKAIDMLNSLLRGEISAAETYAQAIGRVADGSNPSEAALLREIQREHGQAAQMLRDRIRDLGGEASNSSGAWGAWAKTVEGTMSLFGDASSMRALKEGEEHGLKDYQGAIDQVDADSAGMVENRLIPAQTRHIDVLDQLIKTVSHA